MPIPFFPNTRSTIESLTDIFDFLWPTAAAMWNLRWQVQGLLNVIPDIDEQTLAGRFVAGSGIVGTNLRRACVAHTWEQQQERLAEVLLTSVFAIYESWCEQSLEIVQHSSKSNVKNLQFPTAYNINGTVESGVQHVLDRVAANESVVMSAAIFPPLTKHPKYSFSHIDDHLVVYRYFKEIRNCLMHKGGIADQKCVDAYVALAAIPNAAAIGIKEMPQNSGAMLQHRVGLSLRGVVGLTDIVLRLIVTLDARLARHHRAELLFLEKWKSVIPKGFMLPVEPKERGNRLRRLVRQLGWQASSQTQELEALLKQHHLCH